MTIWGIADIHGSQTDPRTGLPSKPMDVFGDQWVDHLLRLQRAWLESVGEPDTVVIAGDIDWGMYLDEARDTLELLGGLPGRKILLRGNHDYWWSSKTTSRIRRHLPTGMEALHNNAFEAEGYNICGTKGSPVPGGIDWKPENEKLLARELHRLRLSLEARDPVLPTIVALHYPPFYGQDGESPYRDLLGHFDVRMVIYGHLHGSAAVMGPRGQIDGIDFQLVAGDSTGFHPVQLVPSGASARPGAPGTALP